MFITVNILAIIFLFAIWNAYVVVWGTHGQPTERQQANKIWHGIALFTKVYIIALAIYTSPENWLIIGLTGFNLSWTIYDLTINIVRAKWQGLPILHVDMMPVNSTIARAITKTGFWALKFLLIAINIILFL